MGETVPLPVLQALDRLNAHARAYGCGKRAIYAYKTLACLVLAHAGALQVRPVGVMVKCHNCAGTGQFIYWDGEKSGERCRTCAASGYLHLRFVETKAGDICWHHPWSTSAGGDDGRQIFIAARKLENCSYRPVTRTLWLVAKDGAETEVPFEDAGAWKPNSGGTKIEGEALAELLNTVEWWIEQLPDWNVPGELVWRVVSAQRARLEYALDLGRRLGGRCHYCGGEASGGQAHMPGLLAWSVPTCTQHAGMPVEQWDKTVPPAALTPEVLKWLARRGWSPGMALTRNREERAA
jgi:hypothetical protein